MSDRGHWYGLLQILRYNWPFFAATWAGCAAALGVLARVRLPKFVALALGGFAAGGLGWSVSSLLAAHYIYDLSPLAGPDWLRDLQLAPAGKVLNLHAGVDEAGGNIERALPKSWHLTADFYDPRVMSEDSISRAREQDAESALPVGLMALPFKSASFDLIVLMFAAHEVRDPRARVRFFGELRRTMSARGKLVLVEHLRDVANFLAFGPGVPHWYSRRTWLDAAHQAGLAPAGERRITPFVRILVFSAGVEDVENRAAAPT
jgi:SAM-dependent methyltransferase